jgi:hypothetical protein
MTFGIEVQAPEYGRVKPLNWVSTPRDSCNTDINKR